VTNESEPPEFLSSVVLCSLTLYLWAFVDLLDHLGDFMRKPEVRLVRRAIQELFFKSDCRDERLADCFKFREAL